MFAPTRILVPTDFSDYSDKALSIAVDIAKQYQGEIFLLHVIDENIQQCAADYCLSEAVMKEIELKGIARSTDLLQKEIDRIANHPPDVKISFYAKQGIPAQEILREQEEKNIKLIVIASHGRTGIQRILMGSVAENVIRGAKCPVLLVRG